LFAFDHGHKNERMTEIYGPIELIADSFLKRHVLPAGSLLHYQLPDRRDNDTVSSLRHAKPFYTIRTRTNKFRNSFILYSLDRFT